EHATGIVVVGRQPSADPDGIDVVTQFAASAFAAIDADFEALARDRQAGDERFDLFGKSGGSLGAVPLFDVRLGGSWGCGQAKCDAEGGEPGSKAGPRAVR